MLNKVCVLTIKVHNIDAAVDFYTNTLDFNVSNHYGEKIVSLINPEFTIVLEENEEESLMSGNNVLLGLVSENVDEDMKMLLSKGVKMVFSEPRPCPPGRYIVIEDPSGNHIELLEFSN
ncbi:VOC family protein [Virgibacillus necropolis]|uniref:VOC family protein n=1 Tax=Virgibacillus necropolis TaxID=163877 RepID=UPI0038501A1F